MSMPDHQQAVPQPGDEDAAAENPDTERKEETPAISEVAMRINLLGRLILPPTPH